jgi:amino acid transporter
MALPYHRIVGRWVLFLHLAAVLGFMLAHGVQVTVMWRVRAEPDPEKQEWLFHSLPSTRLLQVLIVAIVVTGVIGGIVVPYWRQWWMWLSLVLLLAITWAMRRYGGGYFGLMETPTMEVIEAAKSDADAAGLASKRAAYDAARLSPHPFILTIVGLGGLAVILWLMVFKPF